ncbi:MAG: hypothetical protein QOH92_2037 [Chloroflexota bacterium]|nr:hypothetical protein [Chloroflexota bacterium]
MKRLRRLGSDPPTGSWRPGDAQLGWIIENRVDEAYILSWPGQLETWVPVHDTGGYDRARAPLGSYDFRLDQIKGTASLHSGNQVHLSFETPALHPRQNLHFTFVYFDLATRGPADPIWKVPSTELDRVCVRVPGRDDSRWMFAASRSGLARDRAAKYQTAMRELAGSNGWSVLPPKASLPTVSAQPLEANAFFKRAFDAAFLEAATGDEVLMAAQPDVFGRHRLAFSKSTGAWASIAIHGGTATSSTELIQANIHMATFVAHPRHFILVQHYAGIAGEWYPWSWLIRSTDFARLATGKGAYLLFTTTLNPQRANRWTPFRMPTRNVAKAFQAELKRHTAQAAA